MRSNAGQLLFEILFTRFWARLLMLSLAFVATLLGLVGPFLQKTFLDRLSGSTRFSSLQISLMNDWTPTHLLLASFCCLFGALFLYQCVIYLGNKEALWMQRNLADRLYHHTLSLQTESLHGRAVGEIVSIYTTDIPGATILLEQSLPQGFGILFPLLLGPWALVHFLEIPAQILLPILAVLLLINFSLAYRQSLFFFLFKQLAADRVGLVNEWIQNIRILRILDWVSQFEEKIFKVRKIETRNRISMLNNGQTMNGIASSVTFILNLTLIWSLIHYSPHQLSAGTLLAMLWIVAIFLTRPFRQLPWFFTFIFDGWTSLKRVAEILSLQNRLQDNSADAETAVTTPQPNLTLALDVKNLCLTSLHGSPLLKNISFNVKQGEFLAIVGEVGSGKSLLLSSLMGQTGATATHYFACGQNVQKLSRAEQQKFFSFVPQEGFIISATLRENVAFRYETDNSKDAEYLASLKRAEFDLNAERTQSGLETEIGERGVNLSGGQKQRVSLARADLRFAPILLLDDCLSAVDVDTEKKLIENLFLGDWKSRTRVLVTHRLGVLKHVDRILFLDRGKLVAQGTFDELQKNKQFSLYTESLALDEKRNQAAVTI